MSDTPLTAPAPVRTPRRLLCERVLRSVADAADLPHADLLDLTWRECTRRTLQTRTRVGREIALLLPRGSQLSHGDVIFDDGRTTVVVHVTPVEVWVVHATHAPRLLAAAAELGNLHAPVEVTPAGELVVLPDGPCLAVLRRHGLDPVTETRRFAPLKATVTEPVAVSGTFRITKRG